MSLEANKEIARRILEEVFNEGKLEVIDELVSPDHINRSDGYGGRDEYKGFVQLYRSAFPDLDFKILYQIAEGDMVGHHWKANGTHQGEIMGIPPTGKAIEITGTYMAIIRDGLVIEEWGNWDAMGMMVQLGVVPPPG